MSDDEKKLTALQNIAAVGYVLGLFLACGAGNEIALLLGMLMMLAGGSACLAGEYASDRMKRSRELDEEMIREIMEKLEDE